MNIRVNHIAAMALVCVGAAQAQSYTVSTITNPAGLSLRPYNLNNSGQVVGYARPTTQDGRFTRAFVSAANGQFPQTIGPFDNSYASAINNAGQVVGYNNDATGIRHAFLIDALGRSTQIGPASSTVSYAAQDINGSGQVVGDINDNHGAIHAFVTGTNGQGFTELGTLGGNTVSARGINDLGQIAGYATTISGATHAFITDPQSNALIDLGGMGGLNSYAWAVNNHGQAVGYSLNSTDFSGPRTAFITDAQGHTTFIGEGLNLSTIDAYDINDAGQVVGSYCLTDDICHNYVTGPNGIGLTTLDDIAPPPAGANFFFPLAINDSGQILMMASGVGYLILTPSVPEPSLYMMVGIGLVGLTIVRRRSTSV